MYMSREPPGWKYSTMAYAATLKNVGVLYQTLYLVARCCQQTRCPRRTDRSSRRPGHGP